jgi:hypothetical protein
VSWTGVAVMFLEGGEVIDKSCGELYRWRCWWLSLKQRREGKGSLGFVVALKPWNLAELT